MKPTSKWQRPGAKWEAAGVAIILLAFCVLLAIIALENPYRDDDPTLIWRKACWVFIGIGSVVFLIGRTKASRN